MKVTHAALLAALLAASATPAAACDVLGCSDDALSDDSYPPGERPLPPSVQEQVAARHGQGLSLAGFYDDPSLALARRDYARRPRGGYAPGTVVVETPGPDYGYAHRRRRVAAQASRRHVY